jgi:hypothetical protein
MAADFRRRIDEMETLHADSVESPNQWSNEASMSFNGPSGIGAWRSSAVSSESSQLRKSFSEGPPQPQ